MDNNVLFTASDDKLFHIYDAKSRVLVSGFSGHASWLLSVDHCIRWASPLRASTATSRSCAHHLRPAALALSCSSSSRRSPQSAFPLRSSSCCVLRVLLLLLHVNALLILSLSLVVVQVVVVSLRMLAPSAHAPFLLLPRCSCSSPLWWS